MRSYALSLREIAAVASLRRVMLAYLLYNLIEYAAWVGIVLYAYNVGGVGLASLVSVVQLIPGGLLSPAIAGAIDRLPRQATLLLAYGLVAGASALTMAFLLAGAPVAVVVVGATLLTMAVAVARPMHYAAIPDLVRSPGQLVSANAVSSVAEAVAIFLGPLLAGIGVQVAGAQFVLVGTTVAGIVILLLVLRLPLGQATPGSEVVEEGWRDALGGVAALWRDWPALSLLLVMSVAFVFAGAIDVLGVAFADAVLSMGESGAGLLVGAVGIGGLLGGVVSGAIAVRSRLAGVIAMSGAAAGAAVAAVAFTSLLLPAVAALAASGLAATVLLVSGRTLLQRTTDERVLAKVFAVQEGVALLGLAVGAALAPALVDAVGARNAFVPLGLVGGAVVAAAYVLVRRLDSRAVLRSREIRLLSGVPVLAALPPYEMERLARNAAWLDVAAGTDIIRQGDVGERFYAIEEGEFAVTIDGVRRASPLSAGSGFGELALLRSVPRSATVTALTAARVLAISGKDFLAAVTGATDGLALADALERAHRDRDGDASS